MSLLDEASLVQIPSGYKEDKLYSIIPSDESGDFNFSRASTATRVNAEGLIEEMPYNKLTYSNDFSNAALSNTLKNIVKIMGRRSLEIYVLHLFILKIAGFYKFPEKYDLFCSVTLNNLSHASYKFSNGYLAPLTPHKVLILYQKGLLNNL